MGNEVSEVNIVLIILLAIWSLFWKGIALWRAAKGNQKRWFIGFVALIPFNTLGIFEIFYLFKFAKHKLTLQEIQGWLKR
jgi:hypothetical protein